MTILAIKKKIATFHEHMSAPRPPCMSVSCTTSYCCYSTGSNQSAKNAEQKTQELNKRVNNFSLSIIPKYCWMDQRIIDARRIF